MEAFSLKDDTHVKSKEEQQNALHYLKELKSNSASEMLAANAELRSAASLISGFSGWMVLGLSATTIKECPFYSITVVFSASASLTCVIIIAIVQFLAAKLQGLPQLDFLLDVRYYIGAAFLLFVTAMPVFLLSFIGKISCITEEDDADTGVVGQILLAIVAIGFTGAYAAIFGILYSYHPRLFLFLICFLSPFLPLSFFIFPDQFAELGTIGKTRGITISEDEEKTIFGEASAKQTKGAGRRIFIENTTEHPHKEGMDQDKDKGKD